MLTRSDFPWRPVAVGILAASVTALACGGSVNESPSNGTGGGGGGGSGGTSTGGMGGSPTTGGTGGGGTGGNIFPEAGTDAPPDASPHDATAVPPGPPSGGSAGDGPGTTLAMSQMFLGDTTPDGTPGSDAWKYYGYDIDGQISTKSSTYHCKVNDGGNKAAIQTDGPGGIDNSWGYNIMPIMVGLAADATTAINENIQAGHFTAMFSIDTIGAGANYPGLPASMYHGASLGHPPAWNGSDQWPVACEWLTTCLPSGTPPPPANASKLRFPQSYVTGGTWVSGQAPADIVLPMLFVGYPMTLRIHRAVVTMNLSSSGGAPTSATGGMISGLLETDEWIAALKQVAGNISTSLCEGPTFDSIAQQIRAASDIMADGSQNPNATCNAISIGLGFKARAVKLGMAENQQPPAPDPCAY